MGDFRSNKRSGKWSKFKDIPVHGDPIIGKENHMIRFYFENVDGLVLPMKNNNKQLIKNDKQTYLNQLFSRLEVDIFGGVEIRQQHDLVPPLQRLDKQLDIREGGRLQTSHNVHERFSTNQQGGTCMMTNEHIGSFVTSQGSDEEGLGRWSWIKLTGKQITTRVITAYMPCNTRKQAVHATMAQHRRYWKLQGNRQCPRKLLRNDLITKLKEWRE